MNKTRLDALLVERGYAENLSTAKAIIMSGNVFVGGQKSDKPGLQIDNNADIIVREKKKFASRGGVKLEKALEYFSVSPKDRICIDCGASTGGFTDCLLKKGARLVYAVDVGYGLLEWSVRNDPRVMVMERTNVRFLTPGMFEFSPELAVIDLSFISLEIVLPVVRTILSEGSEVLCLIKPQFEADRADVGKKGVVSDSDIHTAVLGEFAHNARSSGYCVKGITFSPVKGPQGNIEFLGWLSTSGDSEEIDMRGIVAQAHMELGVSTLRTQSTNRKQENVSP